MGLDMYLVGHHYNTAYKDDVPRPMLDNKYHIESMNVDLGYWRKHADLHGYIINTFAKGVDECQKIELSEDDLDKIILAIQNDKLKKDHSGFFFGNSTENGFYGEKEKERAISIFQRAKTFLQEGAKMLKDSNLFMNPRHVTYRASW
tara:strand:- start:33 stop:473 length:441 start_codon:yes stop_codon:yes gene_type:complete